MRNIKDFMIIEGELSDVIRLYDSIINEFPEGERKALNVFIRLFETGKYKLLIVYNQTGVEVGYAFLYTIRKLNMLWLDFIVIHPEFQSKGYGSIFFKKICSFYDLYDGMLLEVEIPEGDNQNQVRRISFYERTGAVRLNLKYYLPNEIGGLEMYLYYKSIGSNTLPGAELVIKAIESAYDFIHSDIEGKEQWLNSTINSQDGNQ